MLQITSRTKNIIVTAGGIHVSAAPLEEKLRSLPGVNQALLIGEGLPCLGCEFFFSLYLFFSCHSCVLRTRLDSF